MKRLLVPCALLLLGCLALAQEAKPLATFTLHEDFGVSHPDQIVYFDPGPQAKGAELALLDDQGKPAPLQVMSDGRIAVRTNLPAGTTKSWRLVAGKAPQFPGVQVKETADGYELTNEVVGIRIPKAPADLTKTPAPIQGLRLRDGTWTAMGPNDMPRPAKAMTVTFLERGPLVTRVKVSYVFNKALLHAAGLGLPDVPAGDGPYSTTIELQAGQPSVTFEEACETDISYAVDITNGLTPDKAQYRGHHATNRDAGMEPDGKVYQYGNGNHDALVNLTYGGAKKDPSSQTTYPFMAHWDPWAYDTGWYWQLYDSRPTGSDNLFGIFAGSASRLITPGLSGVSFDTPLVDGQPHVLLQVRFQRLMPTQRYATRMRFDWGIFLGKKSVDLQPQLAIQGINPQMNLHGGVNLNAIKDLPLAFPDPKTGYGTLYAPVSAWKGVADALRDEHAKGGKTFFNQQYVANVYLEDMLRYWTDPTPRAAQKAADVMTGFAQDYLEALVNGEGIYNRTTHYINGSGRMLNNIIWIDQLLASDQLPAEEKAKLKRAAALCATMLWNSDVVPMQDDNGMNHGPENMSASWRGTRYTYTLFLAEHPLFQSRVDVTRQAALGLLYEYTNEAGACSASAHYTQASMTPILNLLQQMQMRGIQDAFATEKRLANYAEWEMQLMTPPEVRYGGLRRNVAVGDGSTEPNIRLGQLGTGFVKANPALSARLMGAWKAMGSPQDNFDGASLLKIDSSLPAVSPKLGNAQFDGWMSVLRHGWETKDETSIHFINGDFLVDHRHNDQGEVVIYALGAPLSLDFGCFYAPRAAGGYLHSTALPESLLGFPWDIVRVPLDRPAENPSLWQGQSVYTPLLSFTESAGAGTTFARGTDKAMTWQRTVRSLHPDPAHPVIVIDDVFGGKELAGKPVIVSLTLMAKGEVGIPADPRVVADHDPADAPEELPSIVPPFPLAAGLNKFGFTGQWGIDWELYTDAAAPMQAAIGYWSYSWQNKFEEAQKILRLRGQDRLRTIILPYRKGERPDNLGVTKQGDDTIIHDGVLTLVLSQHGYTCTNGAHQSVTTFDAQSVNLADLRVTGGPAELMLDAKSGTLTMSGPAGDRTIRLPKGWMPAKDPAVNRAGDAWTVKFDGKAPVTIAVTQDR